MNILPCWKTPAKPLSIRYWLILPQTVELCSPLQSERNVSFSSLSLSYQSALTALKYCRSSENGIAFFDDMTLEILLSSISEQEKNAYLQKTISALSDEEKNLLQTYFEANMSLLGTSQKLFLHKNTVQYKLNHIYQKCRLNPRVFKDAVLLYLALQL